LFNFHIARALFVFCVALAWPVLASADCNLLQIAEFRLDPRRLTPVVDASINGHPVKALINSGSNFSMITAYESEKLGLSKVETVGWRAYDTGGSSKIYWTHVDLLKIGDLAKASVDVAIAGDRHQPSEVALVIGDDVLSKADVEFDLAHNEIRMFKPKHCTAPQLVYWGAPYSQATLLSWWRDDAAVQTNAYLNGKQVPAYVDSGAESSSVGSSAAEADGVKRAGADTRFTRIYELGPKPTNSWPGRFESFALGDEKIAPVTIPVVAGLDQTTMSIGDDFLRAHRVFIDNEDHLILFSYLGGPVFNTTTAHAAN
jgi:predicted aspartyl protease